MSSSQQLTKGVEPDLELIECTRQPGRLRISKQACALQYIKARKKRIKIHRKWGIGPQSGFMICRTCPQGRRYAEELRKR